MSGLSWAENSNKWSRRKERSILGILSGLIERTASRTDSFSTSMETRIINEEGGGLLNILLGALAVSDDPVFFDKILFPNIVEKLERWGLPPRLQEELDYFYATTYGMGRNGSFLVEKFFSQLELSSLVDRYEYVRLSFDEGIVYAFPLGMSGENATRFLEEQCYTSAELKCLRDIAQEFHVLTQ